MPGIKMPTEQNSVWICIKKNLFCVSSIRAHGALRIKIANPDGHAKSPNDRMHRTHTLPLTTHRILPLSVKTHRCYTSPSELTECYASPLGYNVMYHILPQCYIRRTEHCTTFMHSRNFIFSANY